ncbi:MAG: hypothetical protein WCK72_03110 [Actinomycetes bacterium]|nr:hypothetical protein [Actinomycetota bacterium]
MTALAWVHSIALLVHILCIVALAGLLLLQFNKSPRRVVPGVLHAGATALVAGFVMVGIRTPLHTENPDKWPELNNGWVGAKLTVLIIILVLGYRNTKKPEVKNSMWLVMIALTAINIIIALFWK